jgi:hypothetical protein
MISKFLLSASVAGLFCLSSAFAGPVPASRQTQQNPPQQSQPNGQNEQQTQSKTVMGKVTNIAKDKRSFSVQPQTDQNKENKSNNDNGSQSSNGAIVFLINGNTQIKGTVTVGSDVDVEYRPTADGNLAIVITPRNGNGNGGGSQ